MSNKFNASSLTEYSKSYARRLATDYFANHTVISGQDLLKLSAVTQVNLFVISNLSDKWRAEAERLRSPYFDFEHPEVRHALQAFMNTVSQHISMRREQLEPLLVEATRRTLILLFDPRHYFDEALRNQPDFSLSADAARQLTRYTHIHKFVPAAIEERMRGKDFTYVNQALNWLDEILVHRSRELDTPDKYIQLFSEKVFLDPAALLRKSYDIHAPQVAPPTNKSFFEIDLDSPAIPPAPLTALQPDQNLESPKEIQPVEQVPLAESATATSSGPLFLGSSDSEEPVAPSMQPSQAEVRLRETPTLRDDLRGEATSASQVETPASTPITIGETFYRAPIESISKSISLNQKFMFINQLFNGSAAAYNEAIGELDHATNYDQALDLVSRRYAAQYNWEMNSDEVGMLIDILKRRFA